MVSNHHAYSLTFVTESKAGTMSYNPKRVMRQLGYDQSTIQISGEMGCSDSMTIESQFVVMARCTLLLNSKQSSSLTS